MIHRLSRRGLCRRLSWLLASGLAACPAGWALAQDAESVLNSRCSACHERRADGGLARIRDIRKTPEGWDMTIVRMMLVHGVKVSPDERRVLVKHLADTQGLAPAETRDWRYVLEREPGVTESPPDEDLAVMCGRCHSFARVALQRRDAAEWLKLSHFHLGQFPTTEYQALGRDRPWWRIASSDVPEKLGEMYPHETSAWSQWKDRATVDPTGTWRAVGHRPGMGSYHGTLSLTPSSDGDYSTKLDLSYADGTTTSGTGSALLYTGYELRARITLGNENVLLVAALGESGNDLGGRWFLEDSDVIGATIRAARQGEGVAERILSVEPPYIRAGQTATVSIHGVGLGGEVRLGPGVEIVRQVDAGPETISVQARAAPDAPNGPRSVTVGAAHADRALTVYRAVESVRVEPPYTVARVGGAGGPMPPVPAQFVAVGYLNGPDGEPGTGDDQRIGVMSAEWSVDNFNETAAALNDAAYAGSISARGLFMPAGAGLNPQRQYSTNNVGDLAVKAKVSDAGKTLEGTGHLIVTVQRWNDPPIR